MQQSNRNHLGHVPTLKADLADREPLAVQRPARAAPRRAGNGLLWLFLLLQSAVLAAGGWWGWQELARADSQLADAQHNFARINEQLAERIKTIDGKLVSTESSVTSGSESLRQQIAALGKRLDELQGALQGSLQGTLQQQQDSQKAQAARQDTLEQQLALFASTSKAQVDSLGELGKQFAEQGKQLAALREQLGNQNDALAAQKNAQGESAASLKNTQDSLQKLQQAQGELQSQLNQLSAQGEELRKLREQLSAVSTLATAVSSLQKQVPQNQAAISRLERDQLALKVAQENRAGNSPAEFDAFRAQLTRSISNLQAQIQRLQQQGSP